MRRVTPMYFGTSQFSQRLHLSPETGASCSIFLQSSQPRYATLNAQRAVFTSLRCMRRATVISLRDDECSKPYARPTDMP